MLLISQSNCVSPTIFIVVLILCFTSQIKMKKRNLTKRNLTITGNTISNSKVGLYVGDMTDEPIVTKNTFKNCKFAVYFFQMEPPYVVGQLTRFSGNKYIGNKINFVCGNGFPK